MCALSTAGLYGSPSAFLRIGLDETGEALYIFIDPLVSFALVTSNIMRKTIGILLLDLV